MIHLGSRVSALLDGRLPAAEEERWWDHVHACPPCRDLVEREGWIKTRLAGLSFDSAGASSSLKESLLRPGACAPGAGQVAHRGLSRGVVALGGSAVGVAVLGVLALNAGTPPLRPPTADVSAPVSTSSSGPAASPGPVADRSAGPASTPGPSTWTPRGMAELAVALSGPVLRQAPERAARGRVVPVRDTMAR